MTMRKLVRRLPDPVRQGLKYAYGALPLRIRYGRVFWETYNFLQESQWWSREKLEEYQMQQLNRLLHHVYKNVPYYRRWFEEHGLTPDDIQSKKDLKRLPLISKSLIESQKQNFISAKHAQDKLEPAHTGGTTGSPMHFWYEKGVTRAKERAYFERMWRWHGYNSSKDKSIRVTGSFQLGERIEFDPKDNTLHLINPSFGLHNVKEYIKIIERFQPKVILGYPSLIYALAHFINRYGLKLHLPSLKKVFCHSEKIFTFQRDEIAAAFNCEVVDHYGHNEMLALFQKCEVNEEYHIIMEYGITEIIVPSGSTFTSGDVCGEIVATGFNNYAFPMLRYKTGDWAIVSQNTRPCPCGRSFPRIKDVIGRSGDFILTPSGRLVSPTNIEFAIDFMKHFKDVQIVQLERNLIEVQVVPDSLFSHDEMIRFTEGIKSRIGEEVKMRTSILDEIERPLNQKKDS